MIRDRLALERFLNQRLRGIERGADPAEWNTGHLLAAARVRQSLSDPPVYEDVGIEVSALDVLSEGHSSALLKTSMSLHATLIDPLYGRTTRHFDYSGPLWLAQVSRRNKLAGWTIEGRTTFDSYFLQPKLGYKETVLRIEPLFVELRSDETFMVWRMTNRTDHTLKVGPFEARDDFGYRTVGQIEQGVRLPAGGEMVVAAATRNPQPITARKLRIKLPVYRDSRFAYKRLTLDLRFGPTARQWDRAVLDELEQRGG